MELAVSLTVSIGLYAWDFLDGSNTAAALYLAAYDANDKEACVSERQNCVARYRTRPELTAANLSLRIANDGYIFARFCAKHYGRVMFAISEFASHACQMLRASHDDPAKFKSLLDLLLSRLQSTFNTLLQCANSINDSLCRALEAILKVEKTLTGQTNYYRSVVSFIKSEWWNILSAVSCFMYDSIRVRICKYVFQIQALIEEVLELMKSAPNILAATGRSMLNNAALLEKKIKQATYSFVSSAGTAGTKSMHFFTYLPPFMIIL